MTSSCNHSLVIEDEDNGCVYSIEYNEDTQKISKIIIDYCICPNLKSGLKKILGFESFEKISSCDSIMNAFTETSK